MVEVLESYFNDEGLKRNQFLMKQLQSCPDGIPLKKIASMRRVKVTHRNLYHILLTSLIDFRFKSDIKFYFRFLRGIC